MKFIDIQSINTTHGTYINLRDLLQVIYRVYKMYPCRPLLTLYSLLKGGTHAQKISSDILS